MKKPTNIQQQLHLTPGDTLSAQGEHWKTVFHITEPVTVTITGPLKKGYGIDLAEGEKLP